MIIFPSITKKPCQIASKVMRLFFVVVIALSLVGMQPAKLVGAEVFSLPTASILAQEGETKIAVITDFGVDISDLHKSTIAGLIRDWAPATVVTGGDNYHDRSPFCSSYAQCVAGYNDYTTGYTDFVTSQKFLPSYGNHDSGHSTDYQNYFDYLPTTPDPNRLYYDKQVGNIHLWVLNGNVDLDSGINNQAAWLATNVPLSTATWNIAVVHQAPYSTGFYPDQANTMIPYQNYGIDFVISGHNHHYERLVKDGIRYFIAGRAGTTEAGRTCDGTGSAATTEFCTGTQIPPHDNYGYMQIVGTETAISLSFIGENGAVVDTFNQNAVSPSDPLFTTSVSSLASFSTTIGVASAAQTYDVSGLRLIDNITINAPTGFEVSTDGAVYTPTVQLTPVDGVVGATPISVRMTGVEGTWNGSISHVSAGATSQDVAVSGTASEQQPTPPWTAYNDVSGTSTPPNTTEFTVDQVDGMLIDFDTGADTGVTVTITKSGTLFNNTSSGGATNPGTDAYKFFNEKVNMQGVVQYNVSNAIDFWMDLTFEGLDPNKTYTFVTTANRAGGESGNPLYTSRLTRYTISNIILATNASSAGTSLYEGNPYAVYFSTGENTGYGFVARWINISPSVEGTFTVRAQPNDSVVLTYAFGMFMLQEEVPPDVEITSVTVTDIDAPVALATPDVLSGVAAAPSEGISNSTVSVSWAPADNPFGYSAIYTASVTLSAASGYEFMSATTATVNGQPAVVVLNGDGKLTVSYTFPETEAESIVYRLNMPLVFK